MVNLAELSARGNVIETVSNVPHLDDSQGVGIVKAEQQWNQGASLHRRTVVKPAQD